MIDFVLQKKLNSAEGEMQLNVNIKIEDGKLVGIYGSSGAGKTSILRMLAGFMKPDNGFIKMNNVDWYNSEKHINMAAQKRKIGFVFQDYALFPNMNVRENIAFALSKSEPQNGVDELLEVTGLSNLSTRKIQTLSGGQQQRVALARAIARKPSLLLLDEPLSATDNIMRSQLQNALLQIHQQYKLTTILVSHNADEVIKLSDTVIHLEHGTVQQQTTPTDFFLNRFNPSTLTGNIVSIDNNGNAIVMIENRLLKINNNQNLKINDQVEISYKDVVAILK